MFENAFWMLIFAIFFWFFIYISFFYFRSKKKLSSQDIENFQKRIQIISKESSYKTQILDYDVVYHKILLKLWYGGTFWEILKQKPIVIDDINVIWELHKLRNRLAHEFDNFDEKMLLIKSKQFYKEIQQLLKKVS